VRCLLQSARFSFIHSLIRAFVPSFLPSSLDGFHLSFLLSFIYSFITSLILYLPLLTHSFINTHSPRPPHSLIPFYIPSFPPSFFYSVIIYLFVRSLLHFFIIFGVTLHCILYIEFSIWMIYLSRGKMSPQNIIKKQKFHCTWSKIGWKLVEEKNALILMT